MPTLYSYTATQNTLDSTGEVTSSWLYSFSEAIDIKTAKSENFSTSLSNTTTAIKTSSSSYVTSPILNFKATSSGTKTTTFTVSTNITNLTTATPNITTVLVTTHLGDWQICKRSDQCLNGCCSKEFSWDSKLKCTPGGSQCVASDGNLSTEEVLIFSFAETETLTESISWEYESLTNIPTTYFEYVTVYETQWLTSMTPQFTDSELAEPTFAILLRDWKACNDSSQCESECCSNQFTQDGSYKCTPGGDHCVSTSFS
ncbi:hypothetical protein HK096_007232, partial [Nowakowskiella sp. JEL0078]